MEQNNLSASSEGLATPKISESFKSTYQAYKESFGFIGFVYLPLAILSVLGIFIPGVVGAVLLAVPGILSALVTPGFISAVSKDFYPEAVSPYEKLKMLYKDGLKYIVPVVWIGILTGLCVIFGVMLFVVPGIWLSFILGYSIYVLIFDNKKGVEALAYSYIYARNNFWFIFKRLILLGVALSVIGGIISGIFPPEKKLISEISGDKSLVVSEEVKDNRYYKVIFGNEDPYTLVRQPGDEALSAIFNNIFAVPFSMLFAIEIFKFLKKKNGALATEEEVKKTKKKIKVFIWGGIFLPIAVLAGLAAIFGGTAISALRELLPL